MTRERNGADLRGEGSSKRKTPDLLPGERMLRGTALCYAREGLRGIHVSKKIGLSLAGGKALADLPEIETPVTSDRAFSKETEGEAVGQSPQTSKAPTLEREQGLHNK